MKATMKKLCPIGTEIQTLIFSKEVFNQKTAKDWANKHDFKYGKVDEKENTFRLRQQTPTGFKKGTFRTIELRDGVQAVIGCPYKYDDGGCVERTSDYDREIIWQKILDIIGSYKPIKYSTQSSMTIVFDSIEKEDLLQINKMLNGITNCDGAIVGKIDENSIILKFNEKMIEDFVQDEKEKMKAKMKSMKKNYADGGTTEELKGKLVRLNKMDDEYAVPANTIGVIDFVDDIGQIHIKWENGSSLALVPEIDDYEIFSDWRANSETKIKRIDANTIEQIIVSDYNTTKIIWDITPEKVVEKEMYVKSDTEWHKVSLDKYADGGKVEEEEKRFEIEDDLYQEWADNNLYKGGFDKAIKIAKEKYPNYKFSQNANYSDEDEIEELFAKYLLDNFGIGVDIMSDGTKRFYSNDYFSANFKDGGLNADAGGVYNIKNVDTKLSLEDVSKIAEETANILGSEFSVTKNSIDIGSFDLDLNGYEYEGGSYAIMTNGDVVNVALRNRPIYYNYKTKDKYADGGFDSKNELFLKTDEVFGNKIYSQEYLNKLKQLVKNVLGQEVEIRGIEISRTKIGDSIYFITYDKKKGNIITYLWKKEEYSDRDNIEVYEYEFSEKNNDYFKGKYLDSYERGLKKVNHEKGKYSDIGVGFGTLTSTTNDLQQLYFSLKDLVLVKYDKYADGGGVGEFPTKGELTNKDNFLLKYEKKGSDYEFYVYKPITKEVSGYNQIKHSCINKDCPQKMSYRQFVNYLFAELYLDDKKYANGGGVGNEVYIEFLNKEKGFKKDVKNFKSYEEAVKWAKGNFEKFNPDMIKFKMADGGLLGSKDTKFTFVGKDGKVHGVNYRLVGITENGDKETISEHINQSSAERKAKQWVKTASSKYKGWEITAFKFDDGGAIESKINLLHKNTKTYEDLSKIKAQVVNDVEVDSVPEIDIDIVDSMKFEGKGTKISNSKDAYLIFNNLWDKDKIGVHEAMNILFLNKANNVIGYYKHSKGGIDGTVADVEMISALAVKSLAKAVVIAHNHPSGNLTPSNADIQVSKELRDALKLFKISLLDSIIITKDNYKSLADEELFADGGSIDSERRFSKIDFDKLSNSGQFSSSYNGNGMWVITKVGGGLHLGKFNLAKEYLFILGKNDLSNPLVKWLSENSYANGGGVGDINMDFLKVFQQYGFINSESWGHNTYENKNKDIIVFSPKSYTIGQGWLSLQLSNNIEQRIFLKPFTTSALIDLFNTQGLLPNVNNGKLSYILYSKGGGVGEYDISSVLNKVSLSESAKEKLLKDFTEAGYADTSVLFGESPQFLPLKQKIFVTAKNIQEKVVCTYLQASLIAEAIHTIKEQQGTAPIEEIKEETPEPPISRTSFKLNMAVLKQNISNMLQEPSLIVSGAMTTPTNYVFNIIGDKKAVNRVSGRLKTMGFRVEKTGIAGNIELFVPKDRVAEFETATPIMETISERPIETIVEMETPIETPIEIAKDIVTDEVESIKEAIEYLQMEADSGDEEAIEALSYLQDELKNLIESSKTGKYAKGGGVGEFNVGQIFEVNRNSEKAQKYFDTPYGKGYVFIISNIFNEKGLDENQFWDAHIKLKVYDSNLKYRFPIRVFFKGKPYGLNLTKKLFSELLSDKTIFPSDNYYVEKESDYDRKERESKGNGYVELIKRKINPIWKSIIDKFGEIYFSNGTDDDELVSDQVKAEEHKWQFDRYSNYASRLSWVDAEDRFKKSLTAEELDSIEISYKKEEYADLEEHDTDKYHKKIYVRRKQKADGGEILIGGKADYMSLGDIAEMHKVSLDHILRQAQIGKKIELEHTSDYNKVIEIVKDHLYESPYYYTKLKKMEKSFDKSKFYGGGLTTEKYKNDFDYNLDSQSVSCFINCKNTGRTLILKRANSDFEGTWSLISGGMESNELPDETIKREIQEELGVKLDFSNLIYLDSNKNPQGTHHYYEVSVNEEFEPTLNQENQSYKWVNMGGFPSNTHPLLIKYLKSHIYA